MKAFPHASLVLLVAVTFCVCGKPHSAYITSATSVSERPLSLAPVGDDLPPEVMAAAGLGGLDGATVFNAPGQDAAPAEDTSGVMLIGVRTIAAEPDEMSRRKTP